MYRYKVVEKNENFSKYLSKAEKNWKEFGMNSGQGTLSLADSFNFENEYNLVKNRFGLIDPFFIGVYSISMNNKKEITISV